MPPGSRQFCLLVLALVSGACRAPTAPVTSAPSVAATSSIAPTVAESAGAAAETQLQLVWRVDTGIGQPTGIALRADGSLLVVDWGSGSIHSISADGKSVAAWGDTTGDGALTHPAGIAVDSKARVFVADHDNDRIARYGASGSYELAWRARGAAHGSLQGPDVVAIGPDDLLYVSEDANHRVQVFDRGGAPVRVIAAAGATDFRDPTGIAFGEKELYVADYDASRIWAFDMQDTYLRSIGEPGSGPGQLDGLSMIWTDPAGHIVATDYNHGRIQVFAPTGEHLATYVLEDGSRFSRPWGLAVGPDGDLYVAEFLARQVERLRIPS